MGLRCQKGDLCFVLNRALNAAGLGKNDDLTIRSDNGPQMRSNKFHSYLEKLEHKLSHEFIPPKTPNKNAHVESFFSILELEFIRVRYFNSFSEAYKQTHDWIDLYNAQRIHGSLGMRTPNEIVELCRQGQETGVQEVRL